MIDNKNKNITNFCLQQAQAFVDYSAKFRIHNKGELLSIFNQWRNSKQFSEEDAKFIQELVEEFLQEKGKRVAESRREKCCFNNKIVEADKRQLEFEFVNKCSDITW